MGSPGLAEQILLAGGWRDAWRHELRGRGGQWTRAGSAVAELPAGSFRRGRPGETVYDLPGEQALGLHRTRQVQYDPTWKPTTPLSPVTGPHDQGDVSMVLPGAIPPPGLAQEAIREAQHGLDLQAQFLPQAASHQVMQIRQPEGGNKHTFGMTLPDAGEKIEISPIAFDALTGGWASTEKADAERRHWWTPTDPQYNLSDVTEAHEMGHVAMDRMSPADLAAAWDGLADKMGVERRDPDWESVDEWVQSHSGAIKKAVSEYGTTNSMELGAELWREYTMNSHPRPAAKFWGDYVMAHQPGEAAA